MIYHPLLALSKIKGLTEVVIIGFYEDALFADFIKQAKREFPGLSITSVWRQDSCRMARSKLTTAPSQVLEGIPSIGDRRRAVPL